MFRDMTVYGFTVTKEAQEAAWKKWNPKKGYRELGRLACPDLCPLEDANIIDRTGDRMLKVAKRQGRAKFTEGCWVTT